MVLKHELFLTLKDDKANNEGLFIKISKVKRDIEEIHFSHFLDIKDICNESQRNNYNDLSNELGMIFSPHKK